MQSNERICMKLLVCIGPRNNPFHFGDDPDYDPDLDSDSDHIDLHGTFTRDVIRAKEQPSKHKTFV